MAEWRGTLQATVSEGRGHIDCRLGSMTFAQLYREVHPEHRFAIALVKEEYWVIDMYRCMISLDNFGIEIGPYEVFPTLDAAICAAVLNYHRD